MTVTSIDPITDFSGAAAVQAAAIRDHGSVMPVPCYAALATYAPSPVDRLVSSAEALYAAARAAAPGSAQESLAVSCCQLTDFCVTNQFHEIGQTDRGLKISGCCRRLVGLGSQDAAEDPEVLSAFA